MAKFKVTTGIGIKNKHEFILRKADGTVERAYAYNMVLDVGLERLTRNAQTGGGLTVSANRRLFLAMYNSTFNDYRFGSMICLGTGSGIVSPERTALFSPLSYKEGESFNRGYDLENDTAFHTFMAEWDQEVIQNTVISEVGLSGQHNGSIISTHALLEDSEGNPITLEKGELDILTVYSTVYLTLQQPMNGNIKFVHGSGSVRRNFILDLVYRGGGFYAVSADSGVSFGTSSKSVEKTDSHIISEISYEGFASNIVGDTTYDRSVDIQNRSFKIFGRVPTTKGNGPIREVGVFFGESHPLNASSRNFAIDGETGIRPVLRAVLPAGNWNGTTINDEQVGEGDGTETVFNTTWSPIVSGTQVVKVAGVVQTEGTDYTFDHETGEITFSTAPGTGDAVTVDYDILFIPKDENHVLDYEFVFKWAEG